MNIHIMNNLGGMGGKKFQPAVSLTSVIAE